MSIHQILKQYWGYDQFRPFQEEIIQSVLEGKDTLALLPTGGGKSVCYQVPALARDGLCLVVSPLIALIKDQVENLKQKGIPALAIYSGMHFIEIRKILQNGSNGPFKFLYVSPERLETALFQEYLPALHINLLAVDEAHCISQWGYDFRPTYLRIANLREQLPGVPVLAVTASATRTVQDDIITQLQFAGDHRRFEPSFERPNLSYSVFQVASKQQKLLEILKNVAGTSIVYCKSRKRTKEVAELLNRNGIQSDHYHAGLTHEERSKRQDNWFRNKTRVMVCTNAFGMGIDKPDVRTVVHFDLPDCIENYYQEAGRAGRDGKRAYAVLLTGGRETDELVQQTGIRYPEPEEIKSIYIGLMNHLQVAAGTGEGQSFDLDLAGFASLFKFNLLQVTYALKALEQEGLVSFNEMFFKPSTVVFNATREMIDDTGNMYPGLDYLIKGLLRSYEGIFDFPATINENRLSSFLQTDAGIIRNDLNKLHELGIIDYNAQKDSPQILLLKNRMYADSYSFNIAGYRNRKTSYEKRIASMISYIELDSECRSRYIGRYFDAPVDRSCGICDNCINKKEVEISTDEFEAISAKIYQLVHSAPVPVQTLISNWKGKSRIRAWKVIDFLVGENKLKTDGKGSIGV